VLPRKKEEGELARRHQLAVPYHQRRIDLSGHRIETVEKMPASTSGKQAEGCGSAGEKQSPAARPDSKCECEASRGAVLQIVLTCTPYLPNEAITPHPVPSYGVTSLALAALQAQPKLKCADPMCRWWTATARDEPFSLTHWSLPS